MFDTLFGSPETRRILIYLGGAGTLALIGGGIYAAAITAVTPTNPTPMPAVVIQELAVREPVRETPVASTTQEGPSVRLKGERIEVTRADTPAERERGLSGTSGLARDEGMLFVFESDGLHSFWMKDMKYAIDILWMASDGTIVHIVEHASPASYPEAFVPSTPARYALELQADWVRAHDVSIGDKVEL